MYSSIPSIVSYVIRGFQIEFQTSKSAKHQNSQQLHCAKITIQVQYAGIIPIKILIIIKWIINTIIIGTSKIVDKKN